MCDPLTMTAVGLGVAQSAAQVVAGNDALAAQGRSVNQQYNSELIEAQYDHQKNSQGALEQGYVAEIEKRQAVGSAKVRNAGLGIRGITSDAIVAEELQVGDFNVASARDARRSADTAYNVGTSISQANATTQINSINDQMAGPSEAVIAIAAGGLGGYLPMRSTLG